MADKDIDTIIASPPYNMGLRIRNGEYCKRTDVSFSKKYSSFSDDLFPDDYFEFHAKVLTEMLRVSKQIFYNIQVLTGNKLAVFKLIGKFAENIKEIVIWDKGSGQPAMHPNVLNSQFELIIVLTSDRTDAISRAFLNGNFQRGTLGNIWRCSSRIATTNGHNASFPLSLVELIINNFTKKGDLIYDPFIGTGTTAIASKSNGRHYLGSEIVTEYYAIALNRLNQVQLSLIN
jgi:site-specific DNA-methyltransferase (adenine-specific)/modification methylase